MIYCNNIVISLQMIFKSINFIINFVHCNAVFIFYTVIFNLLIIKPDIWSNFVKGIADWKESKNCLWYYLQIKL